MPSPSRENARFALDEGAQTVGTKMQNSWPPKVGQNLALVTQRDTGE
jgi:hypothetical protein